MRSRVSISSRRLVVAVASLMIGIAAIYWRSITRPQRPPGTPPVVAVAPFLSPDGGIERWSGVGLQDEIERSLSEIRDIRVARRSVPSPFERLSAATPAPRLREEIVRIARRLGADYVLDGTVGRLKDRSEIGVRLIRVADGETRWTGTYWLTAAELASFSSQVASAVADGVRSQRDTNGRATGRRR